MRKFIALVIKLLKEARGNALYDWGSRLIAWGWPFLLSLVYWVLARLGRIDWHWGINAVLLSVAIIVMAIGIFRTRPKKNIVSQEKNGSTTPDNFDQNITKWIESRFPRRVVAMDDRYRFCFEVQVPQSHLRVIVRRMKNRLGYITILNRIGMLDEQRTKLKTMDAQERESLLRAINLEASRLKIEPHFIQDFRCACLHHDILITQDLTESGLMDGINNVKFAHSVIHHTINNLLTSPRQIPSTKANECFQRTAELFKAKNDGLKMTFHALYRAGAQELDSNEDLIWVRNELVAHDYDDPFADLDECVLQSEWLDFIKWGHVQAKYNFGQKGDYLRAAEQWGSERGRKETKVRRGVMALALDEHQWG